MPPTQSPHPKSTLVSLPELLFEVIALKEKHLMDVLFPRFLGRVAEAHMIPDDTIHTLIEWMRALEIFLLAARFPRYFPNTRNSERVVGWELRRAMRRYTMDLYEADKQRIGAQLERVGVLLQSMDEQDSDEQIAFKMGYCYIKELGIEVSEAEGHVIAANRFAKLVLETSDDLLMEAALRYRLI
ncbi:hypothetical protein [Armatimonas sp.]|uniref:hypothetical protein n=1 Tax=Armatimonas sp. TaxID=1872638 RepID=UPI00286B1ECB|nr:hypothetical protein [Armatimonas sp.]